MQDGGMTIFTATALYIRLHIVFSRRIEESSEMVLNTSRLKTKKTEETCVESFLKMSCFIADEIKNHPNGLMTAAACVLSC